MLNTPVDLNRIGHFEYPIAKSQASVACLGLTSLARRPIMTELEEVSMEKSCDLLIVGGGLSGVLLAAKLHEETPELSIGLLEKEVSLGGRLATRDDESGRWYLGLSAISEALLQELGAYLGRDPEGADLDEFICSPVKTLGVISGSNMTQVAVEQTLSDEGARAVAGAAAARDWTLVDELLALIEEAKRSDQPISNLWKGTRKSPSAIALEHLARLWGIADLWSTSPESLQQRCRDFQTALLRGNWSALCRELLEPARREGACEVSLETAVITAEYKDDQWSLRTTKGRFHSRSLVVAQSPWEAMLWLPKDYWPNRLVSVPTKTKPISAVLMSEKVSSFGEDQDLPEVMLVTAENTQVYLDREHHSVCFQATIPYEMTLDAPEVVKAVRRLKRSKKKLANAVSGFASSGEHIALVPVAWSQPLASNERRTVEKLDFTSFQQKHLAFCGDSYGPGLTSDQNLLNSVASAAKLLSGR